jgi:endoglucanase
MGNSWVRVPGTAGAPSLALVGHIDEIAVVVTNLGDDGLAAVRPGSGWDPTVMVGQRVDVLTRNGPVPGVVAAKKQKAVGADRKSIQRDDLVLDVGAKDGDELRSIIRPGDNVIWHGAPISLHGNRVVSRAFDNRMGCYVALESARRIAEAGGAPGDVIAVAAVMEEVGDFAGARTAAFKIKPDVAIAIDVTHATDVRGADADNEGKVLMGGGPTISRGPSVHEDVFELLYETSEQESIPLAVEVSARGSTSTDADAVYISRGGVPTGVVSVPLRYMHSPIEMLDLDDLEGAVQLVTAFARRLEPGMSFTG